MDANAHGKLHRVLVTYLNRVTLIMVGDLTKFNGDLVRKFCVEALCQIKQSSLKDQLFKVHFLCLAFAHSIYVFFVYANLYMCHSSQGRYAPLCSHKNLVNSLGLLTP